jgi:glycosyltransferase involved in cell wall biosynthesis
MLVIVGPDDEGLVPSVERQSVAEGTAARVRFLGPLYDEDRRSALAAGDIWALISHTENFGNAVLEAMAAGLPVIVSTAVNVSPEIQAAGAGVVTSLNVDEVATHIAQLLAEPDMRHRLGARARAFADTYDWSNVAPRLVEMYRSVVGAAS